MKYAPIEKNLFIKNRSKFARALKPNSVAIFHASDEMPRTGDQFYPFRQNSDLFYLSGIDQEQTILVVYPDCPDPKYREVLFLRKTNEMIAIWEGHKYTQEEARKASGIETVLWVDNFESILPMLMQWADHVYLNTNENDRYSSPVEYRDLRFVKEIQLKYPLHEYERAAPIVTQLRMIKEDAEVELLQKACDITEQSFRRVLKFVKPGVMEYEIEAEIWHEFLKSRSSGPGYHPIIASGRNACVLHYIDNNQQCKEGDLILFDFGAEYANYNADLSRTIPVNGKFSQRQRDVYNAVLHVFKEARKMLVPGRIWNEYHKEVGKIMEDQLIKLGLLNAEDVKKQDPENPLYKKYFMHGTSHHLGLDVHDINYRHTPFKEGMVFTCEPGIYILEENIGVRIENDILITKNGPKDLMENIPIEADEIEELMNK